MGLISIRQYARLRGIDESAVRKRTVARGGPIPTHGRAKRIDPDEADRLWRATMGPAGAATSRFQGPPEANHPLESGADIRTVQELLGHRDVRTTMIYPYVLNRGGLGVVSPVDMVLGPGASGARDTGCRR